jgi:hypothetical protein
MSGIRTPESPSASGGARGSMSGSGGVQQTSSPRKQPALLQQLQALAGGSKSAGLGGAGAGAGASATPAPSPAAARTPPAGPSTPVTPPSALARTRSRHSGQPLIPALAGAAASAGPGTSTSDRISDDNPRPSKPVRSSTMARVRFQINEEEDASLPGQGQASTGGTPAEPRSVSQRIINGFWLLSSGSSTSTDAGLSSIVHPVDSVCVVGCQMSAVTS